MKLAHSCITRTLVHLGLAALALTGAPCASAPHRDAQTGEIPQPPRVDRSLQLRRRSLRNQEPRIRHRVAACAAEEKQARNKNGAAESRAPNPALEAAIQKLKLPGVAINLHERCVDIEGNICLDKGMLELVACTKGTKEREAIVAIKARPMHIHTALLLLGAKAAKANQSPSISVPEKVQQ